MTRQETMKTLEELRALYRVAARAQLIGAKVTSGVPARVAALSRDLAPRTRTRIVRAFARVGLEVAS